MTQQFLAVDGGNSKTDVVLADTAGTVLGYARGPGSSPHVLGLAGSIELLDDLVAKALGGTRAPVDRVEVYLAGADLAVEVAALTTAVGARGWAREHRVDNDTFALLRAGVDAADAAVGAVAVVCGAGINGVGRTGDGRTARFPALGEISGDWGGGEHIAELALWHAARGEDGRGDPTALQPAVAEHFGRETVAAVSIGLHLGEIPRDRVDELCPLLLDVAATGDPVATAVVDRLADEIVAFARVAITRLDLAGTAVPVVLGGGVLRAGWTLLAPRVEAGIRAVAPRARPRLVEDAPVVGAALAVLDSLGAPEAAHLALRAAVREVVGG
ncbi:N-acetylglucosamine kinase [Pseudonocardia sp. GCM10023141]|uniref:N-acetylglucosamine kinase n=1 Tax=Pseudonocardia sp. GCM10023141 TaxID=3252653 RepID=UPI0036146045